MYIATEKDKHRRYLAWVPPSGHTSEWSSTILGALWGLLESTQKAIHDQMEEEEEEEEK